jgi:hypothetical protein
MLASAQSPAATLTVRQGECTGSPLAGSMMWCIVRAPRLQRRTVVLELASPPEPIAIRWPGAEGALRWSSVT